MPGIKIPSITKKYQNNMTSTSHNRLARIDQLAKDTLARTRNPEGVGRVLDHLVNRVEKLESKRTKKSFSITEDMIQQYARKFDKVVRLSSYDEGFQKQLMPALTTQDINHFLAQENPLGAYTDHFQFSDFSHFRVLLNQTGIMYGKISRQKVRSDMIMSQLILRIEEHRARGFKDKNTVLELLKTAKDKLLKLRSRS